MNLYLKDIANFSSKLTWKKVKNIARLFGSFYRAKWFGVVDNRYMPMTISIEPTTACNLRCPECPSGLKSFSRATGNLKKDFFTNIIDEIKEELVYLIFYFQGEPFINPDFLDMVRHANENNIYTITSTNAHFLNDEVAKKTVESGLDRLIISVDGTTQEVYEQYRKEGKLENVIAGSRNVVKWKKKLKSSTPHIIFQFLVVKPNEHQIDDVKILAKDVGVDEVKLKSAQLYDYKNGHELMPTILKYSRYIRDENGGYRLKYKLLNECWKLWHSAVITWDGNVVPCCFDKDAQYQFGNLNKLSFSEIWNNKSYRNFRQSVFKSRESIDICTNCTEGCQVWH